MITLATIKPDTPTIASLHLFTEQEIFDYVVRFLTKQAARSFEKYENGVKKCKYRGPNGLRCAAGCLIDDSEYKSYFEGRGWDLISDETGQHAHLELIRELQYIHDQSFTFRCWSRRWRSLAKERNLSTDAIPGDPQP